MVTSFEDPRYVKALSHPLRVRILAMLEEGPSSPVQLSRQLGASLGTVAYHVRTLHDLGLLEDVGTEPRRGAVEHYYKAHPRPRISDDAWARALPAAKQAMTDATLRQILEACRISAAAGGFDRGEAVAARSAVKLDERGWKEASKAFSRLRESLTSIEARAAQRLRSDDGTAGMTVGAVLLLFEAERLSDQAAGAVLAIDGGEE